MGNLGEIMNKATELLREKLGKDFKFEEGDKFVFCLNNGVLILSLEEGCLKTEILGDEAFSINMDLDVFVEVEGE